jgi:hypothetical protein
MSNVTYYSAQKLTVGGTNIKAVQSADVDFALPRQDVFEFGTFWAVDNIQVEPATASLNFSYALASGVNNHAALGLDNLGTFVSDVVGKSYVLSGAGLLTLPSGLVNSFNVEGSVGNVPTVTVGVQGIDLTYAAGTPTFPGNGGTASVANVIRPDQISITLGSDIYECRSFSFNVDIPREYINVLGSLTPIANIMTNPPKVTVEAEIVLRNQVNPKFSNNSVNDVTINCGGIEYTALDTKLANFTSATSLQDIQVANITLEAPVKGVNQLTIGG